MYNKEIKEVMKELNSSMNGLTDAEAGERLKKYGLNQIKEIHKISIFKILLNQFKSFIIYVLMAASIIAFLFGKTTDTIIILAIIILNTILGFIQEYKAEKSIQALKKLAAPNAVVIREGKEKLIPASDLVPGDIIIIESGSKISADARIIESSSLRIDESTLTGESTPVDKVSSVIKSENVQIADQNNILFSGTTCVYGRGKAVIIDTGMKTELGKIASSIQEVEEQPTPLQIKLKQFGFHITLGIIIITALIFFLGYFRNQNAVDMFLASLSLAVAAIPEGLPAVITITLALGTQRMLKRNALIRKLPAVETLGSVSVICVDKTGTITKNEMASTLLYMNNKLVDIKDNKLLYNKKEIDKREFSKLFEIASLCNNATIDGVSDPTEKALIVASKNLNFNFNYKRIKESPFDSDKKYMATLNLVDGNQISYVKGAPEKILDMCKYSYRNGRETILNRKDRESVINAYHEMANNALRVLGFAYSKDENPKNLVFTGLIGMIDPPREEVYESIKTCRKAGIKVVMITGDYKLTAQAIASQIGLHGKIITGEELDKLSTQRLSEIVEDISIYARVNPSHKLKIVSALQKKGHIVAMTGDGVNDAPALKKADIGAAVGSGTDVAKESSEMVLIDDNFSTIVSAVEEGRRIYENIKKFIYYLFSSNLAEILVLFIALLISLPLPIIAIQILWINLVTDGLPALALGLDPTNHEIMERKPRDAKEKIINKSSLINLIALSLVMSLGTIFVFNYYLSNNSLIYAQTVAFSTLMLYQMFNVLNYRAQDRTIFSSEFFKNKYLLGAILISVLLQIFIVYFMPDLFNLIKLTLFDWLVIALVSSTVLIFQEIRKLFIKKVLEQY